MPRHETYQLVRREEQKSAIARLVGLVRSSWTGPISAKSPEIARLLGGPPSATGLNVSESTALTYSAFWSAVNLISNDIASLPLVHLKVGADGSKERWRDSRLYRLLHDQPNPEMSSVSFRRAIQAHVLTWGNGYAEIERDPLGRPAALWLLLPNQVAVMRDTAGNMFYRWTSQTGQSADFEPRDILHIAGLGFDGITGYSIVSKARESIGLGLAMEKFGATFFGNGLTFGGVFEHPGTMSPQAQENFRKSMEARHGGVDRAHRILIAEEGMKYQKLGIPPDDAQFLESRQFEVLEMCRWFNMPPHKLGHLADATFSNVEQQNIDYYASTIRHWLTTWEQEGKRKLISPLEWPRQEIEHVVDDFLRADSTGRAALEKAHFDIGGITPNDIRRVENRNPVDGGDESFIPLNVVPLSKVGKYWDLQLEEKAAQIKKLNAPPPPPPPPPDPNADGTNAARAALEQAVRDLVGAQAQFADADVARRMAEQRVEDLSAARDEAAAARDQSQADLAHALERLAGAEQALGEARTELETAIAGAAAAAAAHAADMLTLTAERDTARAATQIAEAACVDAVTRLADAEVTRAAAAADAESAHQRATDSAGQVTALQASMVALEAEVTAARAAAAQADAARADAEQRALAADETRHAAEQARDAALAAHEQTRHDHTARVNAVLVAHRGLIVDVMQRMVEREIDRAKRHQTTPQKFRAWLDVFYVTHTDAIAEALLPSVRAHLAILPGTSDPYAVARQLAEDHVAESEQQLRNLLHIEDFAPMLARTLTQWETTRPGQVADRLLTKGLSDVH